MFDRLKKIFTNQPAEKKKNPNLKSKEEFLQSDLLNNYIKEHSKTTLLLQPTLAKKPLSYLLSKMGGEANMTNFDKYPNCSNCKKGLNFVLQLYKRDFPDFYFPEGKNLFQLFRCPNYECDGNDWEKSDQPMYHYYSTIHEDLPNKKFEGSISDMEDCEEAIPDCQLQPLETQDLPEYEDADSHIFNIAEEEYEEGCEDLLFEEYSAKFATKIGGYPSWTQGTNVPNCSCGKTKEFLFQLSSEEPNDSGYEGEGFRYSAHNIMIGDSGNIYYFYCKSCGEKSIESNWDCC